MSDPLQLSLVIPVFNEAESLPQLAAELASQLTQLTEQQNEVIFIDDGSTDASWETIQHITTQHPAWSGIRLRRNFGKAAALAAGFDRARGKIIIQMDADLQDDPAEIPHLLHELDQGFDLVNGWKKTRHDPFHKTFPSKIFNSITNRLTGLKLHDHNCGLKAMRAEVVRELNLYGEFHRFIPAIAHARGFRIRERPVHHRPRQHGVSKFGTSRFMKGLLDLFTVTFLHGFGKRPQHILGGFGMILFALGSIGLAYLGALWLLGHRPIGTRPMLPYSIAAILMGFQMIALGFLAELVVSMNIRKSESYAVAEETNNNTNP